MKSLFDPIKLGAIEAPNRILMAPLTRARGTVDHLATPIMATYYTQRASAGLIISEAIGISREGLGWPFATGLWTFAQVEAWKAVTGDVHRAGGKIMAQLWHMGRVVHPSVGRGQPVSASATTAPGYAHTYEGRKPHVQARALRLEELPRLVADYRHAARHAMEAGFDGIQLHAANGYLLDQFLRDSSNHRLDQYGGSVTNRVRLLHEVTAAVAQEIGADRTAVRISPNGLSQGVEDGDPDSLFRVVALAMSALGIAFVEVREPGMVDQAQLSTQVVRDAFDGPLVVNSGYGFVSGTRALLTGQADAVSYGKSFLSNPDLPARFRLGVALQRGDVDTFYSQGATGYIDYPRQDGILV